MKFYSIRDAKDGLTPPVPFEDEAIAVRWFYTNMQNDVTMRFNPNDFSLWYLGEWDKDEGIIHRALVEVKLDGEE